MVFFFSPVRIVKRSTRRSRFTFTVKSIPSSRFVNISFSEVCFALPTVPFPRCTIFKPYISVFTKLYVLFWYKGSRITYKLASLVGKLITFFVSAVLHVFTVGHLLKRSTAFKVRTSPFISLLWIFPVQSICIHWPGSVNFFSIP